MLPDIPPRLTTKEAAKLCRVKPGTIRQWVFRKHLDYSRHDDGSIRTVTEADLEGHEDRQIGEYLFDQIDVARAEHRTRKHAHRDLSLLTRIGVHAA